MKILAIDTSSDVCSVAILENDQLIDEINLNNGKTHSENFMPILNEILEKNSLKVSDINLITAVVGPGSFTGIRIGVSSIKAIAEVKSIHIASVTSLESLAASDCENDIKISMIDAKNNQVYCGIFDKNYKLKEAYLSDDINNIIEKVKKYNNAIFIGNGAILHKDLLGKNIENIKISENFMQRAYWAGIIGYKKYLENDLETADTIVPIYLRKSQAERLKG